MTKPTFAISTDPSACMIEVQLSGFWDQDVLERYRAELHEAYAFMAQQGIGPDRLLILSDARKMGPQDKAMLAGMQAVVEEYGAKSLKTAGLSASAILKMQMARLTDNGNVRIFASKEDAVAWLKT